MTDRIESFHLSVPQSELDDLRARLMHTRWPDPGTVEDTRQGPPLATGGEHLAGRVGKAV